MAGVWTRNYYNMLTAAVLADDQLSSSSTPTDYDPPIRVRYSNGSYAQIQTSRNNWTPEFQRVLYTGKILNMVYGVGTADCSIMLGSGTNAPTYDDYHLQTPISSGLTLTNAAGTLTQQTQYDAVTHHISSKRSFTIQNTSASNITVNEVGLYFAYGMGNSALLYREVFDAPIVLEPSESIIITFNRDGEVYNYTPY